MSDNQETLIRMLIQYTSMNYDGCENKEFCRILSNIINYAVMIRDDESLE